MSLYVYNSEIIDREIESGEIVDYIQSQREKNRVLWVSANTGIGKTSLIKKAFHKLTSSKIVISVETPPVNSNDCIIQGQYLSYIASAVNKCLKEHELSLKDFLLSGIDNRVSKAEVQKVLETSISKIPQMMVSTIISRYSESGLNDVEQYLLNTDIDSVLVQREYLLYVMTVQDIIIYISNMQNIDSRSLNELINLSANTHNNFFLFEFTTKNSDFSDIDKYNQLFKENAETAIEYLDTLPIHFAASIAGDESLMEYSEWRNYYNNTISGNLYKLRNIDTQNKNCLTSDPLEKIYNLDIEGLIILQIVVLHDGEISLIKMSYILNNCDTKYFLYFENKFDKLFPYLAKDETNLKLKHSSVKDFLLQSTNISINQSRLIAYGILRDLFNRDLSRNNYNWYTKRELVLHLMKLYAGNDTEKVLEVLEKFKELIVDEIAIDQIQFLIDKLKKELKGSLNSRIALKIIKICYDLGLYSNAYEFLTDNFHGNTNYYMYRAILLNRLDRHIECIDYCNMIENESSDSRFYLTIQLIKMLSLRTLNKKAEYRKLYFNLLNTKEYKNCLEYGFLLRNSEILYSPVNDIPYIQRGIQFFQKHHDKKNEVYAKITVATEYAYAGNMKKAKEILNSSQMDFFKTTTEKHIFYNNIAAVDLQGKVKGDFAFVQLEKGLLSSQNSYDTLTLLSNKICWYIINQKNIPDIDYFKKQLEHSMNIEPDLRISKRIYFNLYLYYKYICQDKMSMNFYLQKAVSMRSVLDDKLNRLVKRETDKYLSSPAIYVSFITYWHFDIPNL